MPSCGPEGYIAVRQGVPDDTHARCAIGRVSCASNCNLAGIISHNPVGADAHIGPWYTVRIRRNRLVIGTLSRGAMWASPPTAVPFIPLSNTILACKNVTGRCPGVPDDIHARCVIVRGHCPPNYYLSTIFPETKKRLAPQKKLIYNSLVKKWAFAQIYGG